MKTQKNKKKSEDFPISDNNDSPDYQRFNQALRQILSVPKTDMEAAMKREREERQRKKNMPPDES